MKTHWFVIPGVAAILALGIVLFSWPTGQRVEKLEKQLNAILEDWKKAGPPEVAALKKDLAALKANLAALNKTLAKPEEPRTGSAGTISKPNSLGMRFVQLKKGTFWMGGGDGKPGEKQVEINADFQMGTTEVTQGQWKAIMGDNPSYFSRDGDGKDKVKDVSDAELLQFPVENVSWDMVHDFIKKLNAREKDSGWVYRLPTEAEWEYACRGGASSKEECSYHFYFQQPTNDLSGDQACFDARFPVGNGKKGEERTCPTKVGSFKPNRLGLYDMHGNVWEWCEDLYNGGPSRVNRGGSWSNGGSVCRASYRSRNAPSLWYFNLGVRVARVPVK